MICIQIISYWTHMSWFFSQLLLMSYSDQHSSFNILIVLLLGRLKKMYICVCLYLWDHKRILATLKLELNMGAESWILVLSNSRIYSLLNLLTNPSPWLLSHSLSVLGIKPRAFCVSATCPTTDLYLQVQWSLFSGVSYLSEADELLPRVNYKFSLICDTGFQKELAMFDNEWIIMQ